MSCRGPFLVDAHVHVYPEFDPERLLSAALRNVRAAAARLNADPGERLNADPGVGGCIMLTETARDHAFRGWRDAADAGARNGWAFEGSGEEISLYARSPDGARLLVVAGRQIATAEGLEVSALGVDREFADGADLPASIRAVHDSGAVAVLPWGFGKWWLKRGKLIAAAVEAGGADRVFVGDSGVRPGSLPQPLPLRMAERRNLPILSGSDPLPLAGEEDRAGSFGFVLDGEIDQERPAEGLKTLIRALSAQPRTFGTHAATAAFIRDQVRLRLR